MSDLTVYDSFLRFVNYAIIAAVLALSFLAADVKAVNLPLITSLHTSHNTDRHCKPYVYLRY